MADRGDRCWRAALAAVVVLLAGAAVTGCAGGVSSLSFADPPSTTVAVPAPAASLPAGLDAVGEAPVGGVTTTTALRLGPGSASLVGTVTTSNGQAVPGATVEVERVVGDAAASTTTTTAGDGSWAVRNILGGVYRIRAWLAPDLDMPTADILYLADGSSQTVTLQETSYPGQSVQAAVNPDPPVLDQPANLVIQVTQPHVGADGVLSELPTPGAVVTLVNGALWLVQNGNPLTTDGSGQVTFQVECTAGGQDPLSAQVGTAAPVDLQMPPCSVPPAPSTTSTSIYSFYPTTTCPPSDLPTTTLQFGSSC